LLSEPELPDGSESLPHRSGLSPDPRGSPVEDSQHRVGLPGFAFTILVALIGGLLGIIGAAIQEVRAGGFILLPILGAPIIEEGLKPVGVYLLKYRWPHLLLGRLHVALLAALAGLTFGVIEALVYVYVYVDDPPNWFVTYRFTLPLALHTTGSFLVGLGITGGLVAWAQGEGPLPKSSRNLYLAAVALHAVYNTVAIALSIAGVFDFD